MLKTALSLMIALSVFIWSGCYEVVSLSRDEYKNVNQYDEVSVLTDTAGVVTKYKFARGMCVVQNDTLIGTGTRMSSVGEQEGANVAIPTSRINLVEVKKLNVPVTLVMAGVVAAITVGAVFLVGAPGASGGSNSQPPTPQ
jgi:hypothetical protein